MLFSEMLQEVYTKTNRPDLITQSISALRSATLKMHTLDFFDKDIQQGQLVFDAPAYIQNVYTKSIPRYRKTCFIRKNTPLLQAWQQNPYLTPPIFNTVNGPVGVQNLLGMLRRISADDILDNYNAEKLDVFYQAGSTLWMKTSTALQYALMGWWEFPNVDTTTTDSGQTFPNYTSWVADERPWAIIYDAVSNVLQTIGMTDAARKYDSPASGTSDGGLVQNEIKRLIADNIVAEDIVAAGGDD